MKRLNAKRDLLGIGERLLRPTYHLEHLCAPVPPLSGVQASLKGIAVALGRPARFLVRSSDLIFGNLFILLSLCLEVDFRFWVGVPPFRASPRRVRLLSDRLAMIIRLPRRSRISCTKVLETNGNQRG